MNDHTVWPWIFFECLKKVADISVVSSAKNSLERDRNGTTERELERNGRVGRWRTLTDNGTELERNWNGNGTGNGRVVLLGAGLGGCCGVQVALATVVTIWGPDGAQDVLLGRRLLLPVFIGLSLRALEAIPLGTETAAEVSLPAGQIQMPNSRAAALGPRAR